MNETNHTTKPGASDPTKSPIAQPVVQPVQPAKTPDAAPPKEAVKTTP
jgi:hypothetical protein